MLILVNLEESSLVIKQTMAGTFLNYKSNSYSKGTQPHLYVMFMRTNISGSAFIYVSHEEEVNWTKNLRRIYLSFHSWTRICSGIVTHRVKKFIYYVNIYNGEWVRKIIGIAHKMLGLALVTSQNTCEQSFNEKAVWRKEGVAEGDILNCQSQSEKQSNRTRWKHEF